jgi:hypothetical protein
LRIGTYIFGGRSLRFLTIAAFVLVNFLSACASTQNGSAPSEGLPTLEASLSASETEFYSFQGTLPLPVSAKPGDVLYRNPMLGIDVVEVLADGRSVAAEPSLVLFVGIDTTTVTVQSGTYIYNIRPDQMLFLKRSKPSDVNIVEFSIPEGVKTLEIRYRLVPHDSDPEPRIYTLTARRVG